MGENAGRRKEKRHRSEIMTRLIEVSIWLLFLLAVGFMGIIVVGGIVATIYYGGIWMMLF